MWVAFAVSDCVVQKVPQGGCLAIQVPLAHTSRRTGLITVAASIEECKPWFHDLRGETKVRLGRSLC